MSVNCIVGLWLSIIPVWWTGKAKNVLEFAGSSKKYWSGIRKYSQWYHNQYQTKVFLNWSKTLSYTKDWKYRIDVEAPKNGFGGVHIQDMKNWNVKYYFDYNTSKFYDKNIIPAPKSIQNYISNSEIKAWLDKAKTYLDIK